MDPDFGYGYSHRHKRTHAQMENDGTASPTWPSLGRLSASNEPRSPSHPHVSGLHLPRIENIMPSTQPTRFPGDGLDYRRPVSLSRNESQAAFIDLTTDDAGASVSSNRRTPPAGPSTTRAQRPPRFAREIIDIEEDDQPPQPTAIPDSPEIEFISARTIDPPRRPERTPFARDSPDEDDLEILEVHAIPSNRRRPPDRFGVGDIFGGLVDIHRLHEDRLQHFRAQINRIGNNPGGPAAPPRSRGPGGRPHIQVLNMPIMDFEMVGFDMGLGGGGLPPPQPPLIYDAPEPAPEGFTRSPAEGDVLLCPNCEDELCVGDTDVKKQVWILKACGHVYCGECATNRHSTSRRKGKERLVSRSKPFKTCAVEGCDKKASPHKAMIQVFL
ncbi:hypothetical protein K469DRAFT_25949 [Zopfia rhizophila CBS 207.26]|uniref:RING-type domain-containing protein n=1 Tax=Zopfia rhizophila CBS 207.26 TaxID=1314779 RepID=A0A6A6EGL7_9PEZI|nr:hypothetical protein K469DRAFT_25949 [Zopfia rhizophila CBS 207.26]